MCQSPAIRRRTGKLAVWGGLESERGFEPFYAGSRRLKTAAATERDADFRVSPRWRRSVSRTLTNGTTATRSDDDLKRAVQQILNARMEVQAALRAREAGTRVPASKIAEEQLDKAKILRRARGILREENAKRRPVPLPGGGFSGAFLRWAIASLVLHELAAELERDPYGVPSDYWILDPSEFVIARPATLKRKFVARLLLVWE